MGYQGQGGQVDRVNRSNNKVPLGGALHMPGGLRRIPEHHHNRTLYAIHRLFLVKISGSFAKAKQKGALDGIYMPWRILY
jgi:hypothetical protein